ncbi:hypothetical protein [Nocardia fluminea]|uniref:hypothetical protein n=1 Tax=Nocardia fluminea TaxID=134984 RepID=UPI0036584202
MNLDRSGEPIEPDDESAPWHDPRCRSGWLGEDDELRPIPCPVCRPWTVQRSEVHDITPSLRAQQAIAAQERKEQDR